MTKTWNSPRVKWSERQDLNLRRLAPKASALARLSYAPAPSYSHEFGFAQFQSSLKNHLQIAMLICKILLPFCMNKTVIAFVSLAGAALLSGCKTTTPAPNHAGAANTSAAKTVSAPTSAASTAAATNLPADDSARESYAVGMYMGHGWKTHNVNLDLNWVFRGIEDQMSNTPPLLTEQQMEQALTQLKQSLAAAQQKEMEARQAEMKQEAQKNQQEGDAFLQKNRTQPGVVTLPDGLQYKVIAEGKGPSPGPNDTVVVNYTGKFLDGTVFDSSDKNGRPFGVGQVIHGWTEALQKMQVGSKWELYIPSDLAYGPTGRQPLIGPNKTLIFETELLDIKPGPKPPPPPQPLTSDIIKVPSAEEMKKGAQIETIKSSDVQKMQQQGATN